MRFRCTTLLAAALSLGLVNAQAAESTTTPASQDKTESIRLLQRIYHPARPSESFVDRGSILLSYPSTRAVHHGPIAAQFAPDAEISLASYITAFAGSLDAELQEGEEPVDVESALYQLALQHPGDTHPSQWHVSSVKAVRRILRAHPYVAYT